MTVSIPCHLRSGEKNESAPHTMSLILRLARKSVSPNSFSSSFSTFLSWLFPSSLSLLIDVGDKSLRYLCPYSERASAHSAISSSALPPILRSTLGHFFLPLSHFRFFFSLSSRFSRAQRGEEEEKIEKAEGEESGRLYGTPIPPSLRALVFHAVPFCSGCYVRKTISAFGKR